MVVYQETGQIATTPPPPPPTHTQAVLHQVVLRAHYQLLVRNNDIVPNPVCHHRRALAGNGKKTRKSGSQWWPHFPRDNHLSCDMQMLKERCAENRCKCRKAGLTCTDLCSCLDTATIAKTSCSTSTAMTIMMKMMTRANINKFQIRMANSTKISLKATISWELSWANFPWTF